MFGIFENYFIKDDTFFSFSFCQTHKTTLNKAIQVFIYLYVTSVLVVELLICLLSIWCKYIMKLLITFKFLNISVIKNKWTQYDLIHGLQLHNKNKLLHNVLSWVSIRNVFSKSRNHFQYWMLFTESVPLKTPRTGLKIKYLRFYICE